MTRGNCCELKKLLKCMKASGAPKEALARISKRIKDECHEQESSESSGDVISSLTTPAAA